MKKIVLALSLAAASTLAAAQGSGFYLGAGVGQSNTKFKSADWTVGSPLIGESKDRTDTAWKLFGGYNFTQNLAVEGGYTDLGQPEYKYTGVGAPFIGSSGVGKAEESSWWVAAKGTLPINDQFNVFAKLGVTLNHLKVSGSGTVLGVAVSGSESKTHTAALVGVGAEYVVMKNIGIRVEYENYGRFGDSNNTGRTNADVWSIGASYKF